MIKFYALPTEDVVAIRQSQTDSYGHPVEVHISDGDVYPCRHCLEKIPKGKKYLILAYRPFQSKNPYAETGPIFLCAEPCKAYIPSITLPDILLTSPDYILRGYNDEERIIYGTGKIVETPRIIEYASRLLAQPDLVFVDIRSARNNCFQCRVQRGQWVVHTPEGG